MMSHCSHVKAHLEVHDCNCHCDTHLDRWEAGLTEEVHRCADSLDAEKTVHGCDQHSCEEVTVASAAIVRVVQEIWVAKLGILVDVNHMIAVEQVQAIGFETQPG